MADDISNFGSNESFKELTLRDAVAPLFRRKTLLIVTFFTVLVGVILAGVLIPPPYKSQMSLLVTHARLDPVVTTESTAQAPGTGTPVVTIDEINSEAQLLVSEDLLEKVVIATGLDKVPGALDWLLPSKTPQQKIEHEAKKLAKDIVVKNETNSDLIDVSYKSNDPKKAFNVLNTLGNFYVQKYVEVHRAPGSSDFFAQETQKYQDALQKSEADLKDFGRQQHVAAPDLIRTDLAVQVATTTGQLYTALQAVAADEQRIRSDEAQMRSTPPRSTTLQATAPADKLLDELNSTLLAAQTKRTQLALKYDTSYPLVKEADQEIFQTKASIAEAEKTKYLTETTDRDATYELLREDLAKAKSDLVAQRAAANAARAGVASMQAEMVNLDQQALTHGDLVREAKANEDNYLLYLAKREQERTTDAMDKIRIGNVAIAVPPAIPALPVYSVPIVCLVAFGLAIFLSVGIAYTVDYFDSSFHSSAQVMDSLGIPVVVSMPRKTA